MKTLRLLSILFISVIVVSCSDDDDSNTTVDPLIGTWVWRNNNAPIFTYIFQSNGNFNVNDERTGIVSSGTWSNEGTNFSSTRQTYILTYSIEARQESITYNCQFSEDFNVVNVSFGDPLGEFANDVWTRQ